MSILRAPRPETHFYILDKRISEDERLSWAARGLLIFLLGKPDHWKVSVQALVNQTQGAGTRASGRDAVYGLLGELIDTGYVQRTQGMTQGGKFAKTDYVVREFPASAPLTGYPEAAEPEAVDPETVDPHAAKTTLVSNEVVVRNDESNPCAADAAPVSRIAADAPAKVKASPKPKAPAKRFDDFWQVWPSSERKAAKADCKKLWERNGLDGLADLILADVLEKKGCDTWVRGFEPSPITYLRGRRWEDGVPVRAAESGGEKWI